MKRSGRKTTRSQDLLGAQISLKILNGTEDVGRLQIEPMPLGFIFKVLNAWLTRGSSKKSKGNGL
jgi:hypothetical protein